MKDLIIVRGGGDLATGTIYKLYNENPLSEAIVIGGLEPLTQTQDILDLIKYFYLCKV